MWGLWSCVRAVPEEDSDDDQHERQAWPGIIGPDWQRLVDAYRAVVGNAQVQVPQERYIDRCSSWSLPTGRYWPT
jgi:hypothetical protein